MIQFYPDEGLSDWITRMQASNLSLRLYQNNVTPDRDTVFADLTESSFTGYAAVAIASGDWTNLAIAAHVLRSVASPKTFTNSGGAAQDVYGYFVTEPATGRIMAVARFDLAPVSIAALGGTVVVTPFLGDFSGPT